MHHYMVFDGTNEQNTAVAGIIAFLVSSVLTTNLYCIISLFFSTHTPPTVLLQCQDVLRYKDDEGFCGMGLGGET